MPKSSRAEIERRLAILDELARLGRRIGPIPGDPVAEMREERAEPLVRILLDPRRPEPDEADEIVES